MVPGGQFWRFVEGLWWIYYEHTVLEDHFFFFFQAEDGIRDLTVTGVQTCALPISHTELARRTVRRDGDDGAAADARARCADGTGRQRRRPTGDGHETRSHDRRSGISAGSVRRAARESAPSDALIRCDAHGSCDAYGGHRAPSRCRRARQSDPPPVGAAGRSAGGA